MALDLKFPIEPLDCNGCSDTQFPPELLECATKETQFQMPVPVHSNSNVSETFDDSGRMQGTLPLLVLAQLRGWVRGIFRVHVGKTISNSDYLISPSDLARRAPDPPWGKKHRKQEQAVIAELVSGR